ncbi:MAG: hypothetical protein EOO60_07665 [Hymenobacter sp.]|nr:MAG: hypothetical protein EOO60_07665 [Hymenobacter sp.]
MATPKKAPRTVATAEWLPTESEAATDPYADDLTSADEAQSAALCPICGDLLAWHEQACLLASEPALVTEAGEEKPVA